MKIIFIFFCKFIFVYYSIFSQPWFQQPSGTNNNLYSIHFPTLNTGFICGANNTILKTTNGGLNWIAIKSLNFQYSNRIFFTNPDTGFVSVDNGLYKTNNSGINWTLLNTNIQGGFYDFTFPSKDTGYGIKYFGNNTIRKTTDGGNVWLSQFVNLNQNYNLNDIHFINNNTGFIVGDYYQVNYYSVFLKTTNGGSNWSYQYYSSSSASYSCLHFINQNTGVVVFGYRGVRQTRDGGNTWTNYNLITEFIRKVFFPSEETGYMAGNMNQIFKTTDFGKLWININNGINSSLYDVYFLDNYTGYVCGSGGQIYKTTDGGVTEIQPLNNEIPSEYKLNQNYPNPFNPTTKIRFDIPPLSVRTPTEEGDRGRMVKITIYDILGREIETLVNEELKPGTYEAEWNAGNFTSGIYYYKLISGDYTETKKMVLIK